MRLIICSLPLKLEDVKILKTALFPNTSPLKPKISRHVKQQNHSIHPKRAGDHTSDVSLVFFLRAKSSTLSPKLSADPA